MPSGNEQVKRETRVAKVITSGRLKATELSANGMAKDDGNASLVPILSDGQSRRDSTSSSPERDKTMVGKGNLPIIPVVSKTGKPLMPTRPSRARELMKNGKAVGKWKVGIFYIQLTQREDGEVQRVAVGIDPGSKREGFAVKSEKHTYLNVLSDAVTWVKDAIDAKRQMRCTRRLRKTPCRQGRENRVRGGIPPSTRARWQARLRIVNILMKLFPVTDFVVEDIKARAIKAKTFRGKIWNKCFSPLEVGKKWFYGEVKRLGNLTLKQGWETKGLRDQLGLAKTYGKMEEKFSAHNVDSWVLANSIAGRHTKPDN